MLRIIIFFLLAGGLFSLPHSAMQTVPSAAPNTHQNGSKAGAKPKPSSQEIADAKAKGLVWVNTATRVYHKEGSAYGATKFGKFMTEEDAKKAGFRMASEPGNHKRTAAGAK